jgi:hypothetical protein
MTVGLSAVNHANRCLDVYRNTAFAAITQVYVKLHTGDPGSAGASNAAAVTTRSAVNFSAASAGSMAKSNTPSWSMTSTETITHISLWDASTAGNFLQSLALSASKAVANGDTLNLSTLTLNFTPIAA